MTGVEFEVIFDDGGDFNVDFDQGEPQSIEFDEEIVINGGGGGASSLSDLDDVDLTSPSDGQVLGFDADTGKWTNQNAGGGAVDSVNGQTGTVVLDAGDLGYDENETYSSGTVGDAITDLKSDLNDRIAKPSSPTSGDFLVWSGSAWIAQSLSAWQGGSY